MNGQDDPELNDFLLNISSHAGSFLRSLGDAALRADCQNYPILRPVLLEMKKKYPDYDRPYRPVFAVHNKE